MIETPRQYQSDALVSTNKSTYTVVGELQPWTLCSFVNDGNEPYPKVTAFTPNLQIAGIVQKRSDDDCRSFSNGDQVSVVERGDSYLYFMLKSGTNARTNMVVSNNGIFRGTIFNLVNAIAVVPGFLIGLTITLYLEKIYRLRFLDWEDQENYIAKVRMQGVDRA